MLGIFFDNEIDVLHVLHCEKVIRCYEINGYTVRIVSIDGLKVLAANVGYTKCQISSLVGQLVNTYNLTSLIHVGNTAFIGGFPAQLRDVAVSTESLQYDVNFQPLGYAPNEIPVIEQAVFPANNFLINAAVSAARRISQRVFTGRYISADQFVASTTVANNLRVQYNANFLDTESGNFGELGFTYTIPYVSIKGISNFANNNAVIDYNQNKRAANNAASEVVVEMLRIFACKGVEGINNPTPPAAKQPMNNQETETNQETATNQETTSNKQENNSEQANTKQQANNDQQVPNEQQNLFNQPNLFSEQFQLDQTPIQKPKRHFWNRTKK